MKTSDQANRARKHLLREDDGLMNTLRARAIQKRNEEEQFSSCSPVDYFLVPDFRNPWNSKTYHLPTIMSLLSQMKVQNYEITMFEEDSLVTKEMLDLSLPRGGNQQEPISTVFKFELDNFQNDTHSWNEGGYLAGIDVMVGHEVNRCKSWMKNKNLDKFLVLDKNQQTLDSFLADVKRKLHSESHTEEPSPMKIQSQEKKQKLNHISPDSSFTTESADPVVSQHNDKNASPQKKQPHPYLKRVREALKNVRNKRPEVLKRPPVPNDDEENFTLLTLDAKVVSKMFASSSMH